VERLFVQFPLLATGALEEVGMPLRTRGGKLTKLGRFERDVDASKLPGGEREKYAIANFF